IILLGSIFEMLKYVLIGEGLILVTLWGILIVRRNG
ncbi:hypothetical protein LCGC14_1968450, partial [marine sediment metagenome]